MRGDALHGEASRGGWTEQAAEANRREEKEGMESSGSVLKLPAGSLLESGQQKARKREEIRARFSKIDCK